MQSFKIRYCIVITLLLSAAVIVYTIEHARSARGGSVNIFNIPAEINGWKGKTIPVEKNVIDILETESVLMREYSRGKDKVLLTIVYYRNSNVAFHLPESCGIGQGSEIVGRSREPVLTGTEKEFFANKLIFRENRGAQVIVYYYETNGLRTDKYGALRLRMIKNRIQSRNNYAALVRFSTPGEKGVEKAVAIIKDCIDEVAPVLQKYFN